MGIVSWCHVFKSEQNDQKKRALSPIIDLESHIKRSTACGQQNFLQRQKASSSRDKKSAVCGGFKESNVLYRLGKKVKMEEKEMQVSQRKVS